MSSWPELEADAAGSAGKPGCFVRPLLRWRQIPARRRFRKVQGRSQILDAAEISSVPVSQVRLDVRGTIGVHGSQAGVSIVA